MLWEGYNLAGVGMYTHNFLWSLIFCKYIFPFQLGIKFLELITLSEFTFEELKTSGEKYKEWAKNEYK